MNQIVRVCGGGNLTLQGYYRRCIRYVTTGHHNQPAILTTRIESPQSVWKNVEASHMMLIHFDNKMKYPNTIIESRIGGGGGQLNLSSHHRIKRSLNSSYQWFGGGNGDKLNELKMNKLVNNLFRRYSVNIAELPSLRSKPGPHSYEQKDYKNSLVLLNQLQTNAQYIKQAVQKEKSGNAIKSLEKTVYFLSLLGIKPEDLNRLNVIHVAGTKGKGSTCAFIESILRANGYKTGFYSSPHLVVVRERIRINGEPISEEMFAEYFSVVYNKISNLKDDTVGMPAYFNFLTVMALYLFLAENVDVAILEVGIGGEYDCTNVVPRPVVTGITSLDLDHCNMLGNTIGQIAWQKSGIFKSNVPAFTVAQCEDAMKILRERSIEKHCPLYVVPDWPMYPKSSSVDLGEVQKLNATLAVQMCHHWLTSRRSQPTEIQSLPHSKEHANVIALNDYSNALAKTKWLGRCQVLPKGKVTYFLDSAHTKDSMNNCCDWFVKQSQEFQSDLQKRSQVNGHNGLNNVDHSKVFRILIFNRTGDRSPFSLLSKLAKIDFDFALFTTNRIFKAKSMDSDQCNLTVTSEKEKEVCSENARTWMQLCPEVKQAKVSCIVDAIDIVNNLANSVHRPVQVLITGSCHLIGGFLSQLHPDFISTNDSDC